MSSSPPRLILASASPRRQELLRAAGYAFEVHPSNVDEDDVPTNLRPAEVAEYLAFKKARAVATELPDDVVLGADTVVTFGEQLLGKPADANDARRMLRLLEGTTHIVITGIAVVHVAATFTRLTRVYSAVRMRSLSSTEIDRYVATDDWQGKAGGYGLQDADLFPADNPGDRPFVMCLTGSSSNIVGLPMERTRQLLNEAGITPMPSSN